MTSTTSVFVYGTLKCGYYNHYLISSMGGQLQGKAVTKDPFAMVVDERGIPYLVKQGLGHRIHGEVYSVGPELLAALDKLEGVPSYYYRSSVKVCMDDGGDARVDVYIKSDQGEENQRRNRVLLDQDMFDNYSMDQHDKYVPPPMRGPEDFNDRVHQVTHGAPEVVLGVEEAVLLMEAVGTAGSANVSVVDFGCVTNVLRWLVRCNGTYRGICISQELLQRRARDDGESTSRSMIKTSYGGVNLNAIRLEVAAPVDVLVCYQTLDLLDSIMHRHVLLRLRRLMSSSTRLCLSMRSLAGMRELLAQSGFTTEAELITSGGACLILTASNACCG